MTEMTALGSGNALPIADGSEQLRIRTLEAVRRLDPELFEHADTTALVSEGAQFISEVTCVYGTHEEPLWHEGSVEHRPMAYHNGGEDGHTSAGEHGVGVPRAVLLIAAAVNTEAERVVYSPLDRALAFYAASAHDHTQNCGRALLPEGNQGQAYGDERLSAELARDRLLRNGYGVAAARSAFSEVMATAFNPTTNTQNVRYDSLPLDSDDPADQRSLLGQELIAAADLLSLTCTRGLLTSVENAVEALASNANGRALQRALAARGMSAEGAVGMEQILDVIGQDEALRRQFAECMAGSASFFRRFQFSDRAIRRTAGGKGIDDLFPGRVENAVVLAGLADALRRDILSPVAVWRQTRHRAGYLVESGK